MRRVYLDHNASMPLRAEARAAMIGAMDLCGNPSSVHGEGRAARGLIERARAQVAAAFGADGADVVFTSGATEAAALACAGRGLFGSGLEHDAVAAWTDGGLAVDSAGLVQVDVPGRSVLQMSNSETGIVQELPAGLAVTDATQSFGKMPVAFNWCGAEMALISAHKIGGPKGVGALVVKRGTEVAARIKGGGQEMGRRAGTENLIGIAGFGAAAKAAARDLADGVWDKVAQMRDLLQATLEDSVKHTIFVGNGVTRLPNTLCIATSGWKGETQVMQMDLAGYAISAGSACSSGKLRASGVLRAMGYDDQISACAIRVSLGPETTKDDVMGFATAWLAKEENFRARAA
ncbi:MAG: aminotransferase class V-fold PLP-dependent enzyme [Rhodobacteraceae bacterium]|nr:aminotransferase class V-fold PLP-dependent enzyme [Paracoccaceae bacterium]